MPSREEEWSAAEQSEQDVLLDCLLEDQLRMRLSARDSVISKSIYLTGTFEPEELAVIRENVKAGSIVADIGASIGVHTLVMAQRVGDDGAVHAFEPSAAYD